MPLLLSMARLPLVLVFHLLTLLPPLTFAYTWPAYQYDMLEQMLYEGRRSDGSSLASIVHPCRTRTGTGASIAAEWLRFAFHDMATHNVDDGTGGLDGSIVYEPPENFGPSFNQTVADFQIYPNKYVSRADIIAIAAIFAVSSCGGPIISFRGGRIDAWVDSGGATPRPQDDLATLTENFRKQGFTQVEMIKLVACGHTVGGVRSSFPGLVPPDPNSAIPVIVDFDTTPAFDNAVAIEYLDGTTKNPLVVTSNKTMASDLRVFEADNNVTMINWLDETVFTNECQIMLGRMLNVVPSTVNLTSQIVLLLAKVNNVQLTFEKNNLVFKATLRLAEYINVTLPATRTVTMFWCDRYGSSAGCRGKMSTNGAQPVRTVTDDPNISPITLNMGYYFINYNFIVPINESMSISKFWFVVDDYNSGGKKVTYNNGGGGYLVDQDQVLLVPMLSSNTLNADASRAYSLVAAVRQDLNPSRVYLIGTDVSSPTFSAPVYLTVDLALNSSYLATQGYTFYSCKTSSNGSQLSVDLHAISGSTTYLQTFAQTLVLDNTAYIAPSNSTKTGNSVAGALGMKSVNGVWTTWVSALVIAMLLGSGVLPDMAS